MRLASPAADRYAAGALARHEPLAQHGLVLSLLIAWESAGNSVYLAALLQRPTDIPEIRRSLCRQPGRWVRMLSIPEELLHRLLLAAKLPCRWACAPGGIGA
jgi:hypothetical protein